MRRRYRQGRRGRGHDRAAQEAAAPVLPAGGDQLVRDGGGKAEPGGKRGEQQARGLGAAALGGDDLREQDQRAEQDEVGAQRPEQRRAGARGGHGAQVEQRRGDPPFVPEQGGPGEHGHGGEHGRRPGGSAQPGQGGDGQHAGRRRGGEQDGSARVGAVLVNRGPAGR